MDRVDGRDDGKGGRDDGRRYFSLIFLLLTSYFSLSLLFHLFLFFSYFFLNLRRVTYGYGGVF